MSSLSLKYGTNPHQDPAEVLVEGGEFPFTVVNGRPGYINFLDALNAWQLVHELRAVLDLPAAASFKHVSPAGAGVAVPLDEALRQAYRVGDKELSPLAQAYARARGADRLSSFGDFIALSDVVDAQTAALIAPEVSDGVVAPGFSDEALEVLRRKKKGGYILLAMDPDHEPPLVESRTVFGVTMRQRRNDRVIDPGMLEDRVTRRTDLPDEARRDLLLALVTLKYTQSNSVCFARDGQVIGNGAGQQSRVHCTRLAGAKADRWYLRQHPAVLGLRFRGGVPRAERDNVVDQFLDDDTTERERAGWDGVLEVVPERLTAVERREWLDTLTGVSLGSDAYFPFDDSIHRAAATGVEYVVQPGGSVRDDAVIEACDHYGMVMAFSRTRLFHH
ncbi:phosphoribosylaminoimidazolecarboxamide formyltransferase [Actinokineospora sp. PR83]|uniref:phosphoribosylaminoimidazolecarboxamide formyltransferase n=1 Tax=Actinokineospora sp. PR83 TaxID=2884908 RepID=UPI001F331B15|nr:phosphoribosylaminoimidazolecarboxamide formyltransferase [Actinokineospora sp. PR83]MCG8915262.1 phosphoribosylaminoimidazolecarboxamide formyltransferase [Actinokineospora sp. PR83]